MSVGKTTGFALLGVWAASELWRASPVPKPPEVDDLPSSDPATRAPAEQAPRVQIPLFVPEAGYRYTYSFHRKIRIVGTTSQSIPDLEYQGKFYIDVLSADVKGFRANLTEEINGHQQNDPTTVFIEAASDASKTELKATPLRSETDRQHLAILKDLTSLWLFPLNEDTAGNYRASFSITGPLKFEKIKRVYLKTGLVKPQIESSSHRMVWNSQERIPQSLMGEERTNLGSGQLSFSSESGYQLEFLGKAKTTALGVAPGLHSESWALAASTGGRTHSRVSIKNGPLLLKKLSHLAQMSSSEQLQLFSDLADLLKFHPEFLADLLSQFPNAAIALGPTSPLFKLVVGVLATAGTPESQAALVEIYRDPSCTVQGKGTILSSLTTTQASLTDKTREFLISESRNANDPELSSGATWALGSSLQNAIIDSSVQRAIESIQQSWGTLVSASRSEQLDLLDAMGNSGRAEFFPILNSVANGQNDALQAKAVFALRFIQTPDAINLLDSKISDSNPTIRLAAASAMQLAPWHASFQAPLLKCAAGDPVPQVQSACKTALSSHPDQ